VITRRRPLYLTTHYAIKLQKQTMITNIDRPIIDIIEILISYAVDYACFEDLDGSAAVSAVYVYTSLLLQCECCSYFRTTLRVKLFVSVFKNLENVIRANDKFSGIQDEF